MIIFTNIILFLVNFVFDLYIIILILRLLIQKLGSGYYNPISQFVIQATNLFVLPLQLVFREIKGLNLAIISLIIIFEFIQAFLIFWLRFRLIPHFGGLLIISIGSLGSKFVSFYFYVIMLRVIMNLVIPLQQNPVAEIVFLITEPIIRLMHRLTPVVSTRFDFSSFLLLILFSLISFLIFGPLISMGMRLAMM